SSPSCSSSPLGGEVGRGGGARRCPLSWPLPLAGERNLRGERRMEAGVTMPRIPYFDVESASGRHAEFLEKLKPHVNIYRMLANSESGIKGFTRMGNALLHRSELDPVLREIAILRVGRLSRAAYEVFQHERIAREAGVAEEKIAALRDATIEAPAFTDQEKAVLRFTDEVVRNIKATDRTFKPVQALLSPG